MIWKMRTILLAAAFLLAGCGDVQQTMDLTAQAVRYGYSCRDSGYSLKTCLELAGLK
jgi:uncharacterized lipoprotein YajG